MMTYTVSMTKTITLDFPPIEIKAESEEQAFELAAEKFAFMNDDDATAEDVECDYEVEDVECGECDEYPCKHMD